MNFLSYLLALSVPLLALLTLLHKQLLKPKQTSPPQPSGAWPVIGHLHLLGRQQIPVHRVLASLADKYGPVFSIRLGIHTALVISSSDAVKECFTTNDKILNKRPASTAGQYLGYNYAGFGFTQGPFWREVRKLVLQELLSVRRLETLKNVRETEIQSSITELYKIVIQDKSPGKGVSISKWAEELTLNVIMRMITGKRYTDGTESVEKGRSFREVVKEFMFISGQFVVSDSIPFGPLRWIDYQGHIKSMKRISEELSIISEKWIDQHIGKAESRDEQDFIDVMLSAIDDKLTSFGHSRETIIKATILNLILAGSDTTAIHITWLLSLLLNHPHVMQRAQHEIDTKVGKDRWVQDSDINNLVYLQAIVKETLRLFPPGPLSVPHEATQDCHVTGYHVSKGTRILVNVWKLHRDPRIWPEPEKFMPERFLTSHAEVDFNGHCYEFVPFGSGRRSCPGITFATQVTHLAVARLLQGFGLKTESDGPVDMTEGMGITLPKANPLEVIVTPRLADGLYEY
ncbi:hypothetical protein CASFOL_039708 [Castilleja foliolosa]|uniref:Flavonoid-6-hydroxylase n=1 Tax=Castilleja foliolosa TaxID=1961234 RepID=A0ABD3BFZ5_9LAMI